MRVSFKTLCNLSPNYFSRGSKHGLWRQVWIRILILPVMKKLGEWTPQSHSPPIHSSVPHWANPKGSQRARERVAAPCAGSLPAQRTGREEWREGWRANARGPAVLSRLETLISRNKRPLHVVLLVATPLIDLRWWRQTAKPTGIHVKPYKGWWRSLIGSLRSSSEDWFRIPGTHRGLGKG